MDLFNIAFNTFMLSAIAYMLLKAYKRGAVDLSAIVATCLVGLTCLWSGGWMWILVLCAFFVLGMLVSGYRKDYKDLLGCGQHTRTWRNVYGNGGIAFMCAISNLWHQHEVWFLMMFGAMACAFGDTCATELGQVYGKHPVLLSTLKRVRVGTPGAVSLDGLLFAYYGSALFLSPLLLYLDFNTVYDISLCAFAGVLIDSLLGSTAEARRLIDTHQVNFIATGVTATLILFII